jgi:hypothetical protein
MYTTGMKIGGILFCALCAVGAALLTVHVFLDPDPELRRVVSADGMLVVTGNVYASQRFSLEEEVIDEPHAPLLASRYRLLPDDALFSQPLVATLPYQTLDDVLYYIDDAQGYLVPLVEEYRALGERFFSLQRGGSYAIGEKVSVEVPTFVDVVTALRARLPLDAVSYALRLVAAPKGGMPVLLSSSLERGGCGGVPFDFLQTVVTQESRTVQVLVNDVLTETTFTFLMEIGTAPNGCPEDMPMAVIY